MSKREISILIKARNAMATGLGAAKRSMQAFGAGISQIAQRAKRAMAALTVAAIAAAREFAKFEAAANPFARFTGGIEGAKQHLKDLQDIGRKGVIPTDQIIQASRELMQFSDGLLGGAGDMKALSDVAATTGNDIGQVTSGVRDFMRAVAMGRDVDRASRQIQQLGIVSLDARDQLRRIQEQGGSTQEMFDVLAGEINKFAGGVETDMTLGAAAFGRLRESGKAASIDIGESIMGNLTPAMDALGETITRVTDSGLIQDWSDDFVEALSALGPAIDKVKGWLSSLWEGTQQGIDAVAGFGVAVASGSGIGDAIDIAGETMRSGSERREQEGEERSERADRKAEERKQRADEIAAQGFGGTVTPDDLAKLINSEGEGEGRSGREGKALTTAAQNVMSRMQRKGHEVEQYGAGAMSTAMQEARAQMTKDNQTRLMERSVATEEAIRELLEKNLGAR